MIAEGFGLWVRVGDKPYLLSWAGTLLPVCLISAWSIARWGHLLQLPPCDQGCR